MEFKDYYGVLGVARAASADDREELVNLERTAWEAVKHKDRAALARLFGEGYFDFGSDGRYDPEKVINTGWMNGDTLEDFSWTDLQVKFFGGKLVPKWQIWDEVNQHAMWTAGQIVANFRKNGMAPPSFLFF